MTGLMEMVIPKVERVNESRNYGKFAISPMERGFGVTIGNALRRIMLSSLSGAAVTSMRIVDVLHEFGSIPGVREDVIQIMMQIKQLRMILHDVEESHLQLDIKGSGTITAADIICPSEVEIVNPELYLFSVDDKKAHIEIDLTVQQGRGYSPAGERIDRLPIGELGVDAIYTPVKRVNWNVESARVGQSTNYNRLILEVWTDGTVAPETAIIDASKILIKHFSYIAGTSEQILIQPPEVVEEPVSRITNEMAETPIESLDLSVRVFNALKRTGVSSVGDVLELLSKGDEAVLSIRNFGEISLNILKDKMKEKGYLEEDEEIVE